MESGNQFNSFSDSTLQNWQRWGDEAVEWTKLAAAFRTIKDPDFIHEMAAAGEAEAAVTLNRVRGLVAEALEEKSNLSSNQEKEESIKHAEGDYATKTAALGRIYVAETLWFSVFRAWAAAAEASEGDAKMQALVAAATTTASATEKTQKLAVLAPSAAEEASSKWKAAAQEWEVATAEMTQPKKV